MRSVGRWRFRWGLAAAGVLVMGAAGYAAPASAASAAHGPAQAGPVSQTPAAGTPELVYKGALRRIRQLVQCGGTMYAVGLFGSIVWHGQTYARSNVFSFRATSPFTVTPWSPHVNGIVDTIAFQGSDCSDAYIGGKFTSVNGTPAQNLAEISTSAGSVVPGFGHRANGEVDTLAVARGHLLAGGYFTSINGSTADPAMASLNPVSGQDDHFLDLHLSGHYHYCNTAIPPDCTTGAQTYVYNQQLSHSGTLDLAEGDFTSVGGHPRQQIFMLNLATDPATVTGWTSPDWDGSNPSYPYQCWFTEAFYMRSAAWSPNDQTVYIADTGYHPWKLTSSGKRTGLCDASAAIPATQKSVTPRWITYTGCYSLYAVAADDAAVYVAGHPKYAYNPDGCKYPGPGAVPDLGMAGLSPATGKPLLDSHGQAAYSMSPANADDMLVTSQGLWIASSNRYGSQVCEHHTGHSGICLLPYG